MKVLTVPVAAAVMAFCLTPVKAFQETTVGGQAPASVEAKANVGGSDAATDAPGLGLSMMTPNQKKAAAKSDDDSGFSIPGLGRFGVLPKMNFGLELLYGQGEAGEAAAKPQEAPIDDLMIRGSVKHNF